MNTDTFVFRATQRRNLICKSPEILRNASNCNPCADHSSLPLPSSLDPDQKEQLIEVIEKLLKDRSTVSIHSRSLCALGGPLRGRPLGGAPSQAFHPPLLALHHTAHSAVPRFVNTHLNPHIFRCSLLSVHLEGAYALMPRVRLIF